MEADWEVEVGGGAPVIEALWPGFVDLRSTPERISEIAEAVVFSPLARLLLKLNSAGSPLWTAKCDLWEPVAGEMAGESAAPLDGAARAALACYVDLLPLDGMVFARWQQAEAFCRDYVTRLLALNLPECSVELVVRVAIAGHAEGFGVTAYLSATGPGRSSAADALGRLLASFVDAIPMAGPPATAASKLQWEGVGE